MVVPVVVPVDVGVVPVLVGVVPVLVGVVPVLVGVVPVVGVVDTGVVLPEVLNERKEKQHSAHQSQKL